MQPAILAIQLSDVIVYMAMPAIGIVLIVVFVLSFFLPFGNKLEGTKQLIKGFGMDIQVSTRTILMLGGLALLFTGVFLQWQQSRVNELNQKIGTLNDQLQRAQDQLARAGRQSVRGWLMLPANINAVQLDLKEVVCRYSLGAEPDRWVEAILSQGYSTVSLGIALNDIGRDDVIQKIVLCRKANNEVLGTGENLYPLHPTFRLEAPK
jgi:hypothetical protein